MEAAGVLDEVGLPEGLESMTGPELAAAFAQLLPVLERLDRHDSPAVSAAAAGLQAWARAVALRVHLGTAKAAVPPPPEREGELNRSSAPYLAVSLGVSDRAANREISFAWQVMERLPMLGEAMLARRLTEGRARVLCDWTTGLPEDLARRACAQVLEWASDKPATRIRERITAVAGSLDPGYAERQYRAALAKCGVSAEQLPDGTGELRAHHVPLDEAAATKGGLDALAKAAKADGDPRRIGRLRWLIIYGLADGHLRGLSDEQILAHLAATRPSEEDLAEADAQEEADRRTAQRMYDEAVRAERSARRAQRRRDEELDTYDFSGHDPGDDDPGGADPGDNESGDDGPGDDGPGDDGPGDDGPGDAGPGDDGPGDAEPGDAGPGDDGPENDGPGDDGGGDGGGDPGGGAGGGDDSGPAGGASGSAEADIASDSPAADTKRRPHAGHNPDSARPCAGLARARPTRAALAGAARPATAAGVQLRIELSTLLGLGEHPADLPGYGPVPAPQARRMAHTHARGRWCWAVLDPDGHVTDADLLRARPASWPRRAQHSRAVVEILLPADLLDRLTGPDPGVDPDLLELWAPVITAIARDVADPDRGPACDPARRLANARLRRQVQIGYLRCTWPGCRQRARDCDLDHTRDHAHGGPTTGENLKPLCKKHHALKTDHGWRTRDTGPHSYELRAPNGTRHHVDLPPAREPLPDPHPSTDISAYQQYDSW